MGNSWPILLIGVGIGMSGNLRILHIIDLLRITVMETKQNSFYAPRLVLGLGIILIGILFLLGNMDIIDPHEYLRFWPAILIVIGISYLIQCQQGSGRMWGIILTFIGSAMLLDRLYFIRFSLWDYWPLILVFVGIMMIVRSSVFRHRTPHAFPESFDAINYIKTIGVMGGFRRVTIPRISKVENLQPLWADLKLIYAKRPSKAKP